MPNKDKSREQSGAFVRNIVEQYGAVLHRYLVKRLRAGEDAQDVAQEVYLRLLRLERSDLIRQPAAYVYFVAAQIVAEARMREAKRPLVFDTELLEQAADGGVDKLVDLPQQQLLAEAELARLLRKLSVAHRSVFLLRKRDGHSPQEIADMLQMSLFKVKRYLVEANAILESKLREEEP